MKSKDREWVRIVVALLILVGLVTLVSLKRKRTFQENEKEETSKKLFTLNFESYDKIEITNSLGNIMFQRRSKEASGKFNDRWARFSNEFDSLSDWAVTAPYQALTDLSSINTLIENIKDLKSERMIDDKGANPSQFGLDPATVSISLFEKGKADPTFLIKVGEQNSSHSGLYLQTSASKAILLGTNSLEYLKNRKLNDWRKKEIFGIKDLSKISRLNVTYNDKGKRSLLLEQTNGKWFVKTNETLPGDRKEIEDLLGQLKGLSAIDVMSEDGKDQKKYGFDRPYARFDLMMGEGGQSERSIEIGSVFEKDKNIYLRRMDEPTIFTVRKELKASLTKEAKQLVNRKPFSIGKEEITSFLVEREAGTTLLSKKNDKWWLEKPVADRADDGKVSTLLNALMDLKADEFLGTTRPPNLTHSSKWKISKNGATEELSLYDVKDKDPIGEQGKLYYRYARKTFENLVTQVGDLRDRAIRPSSVTDFSSLTLKKGNIKARFTRTHDEKWSLGTLEGGDAALRAQLRDGTPADKILQLTDGLLISKFVDSPTVVDEKAADSLVIEFQPKTGELFSWVFGKKDNDQRFTRSLQRNIVGMVPASPIDALEALLTPEKKEKAKG